MSDKCDDAASEISGTSPFRRRFDRTTRREAWENLLNKKNSPQGQVALKPRISASPSTEEEKTSTDNTTVVLTNTDDDDEVDAAADQGTKLPQHLSGTPHYYRVSFKGVVALVQNADPKSRKTGAYVSYGEVFESRYQVDVEEMESVTSVASPPVIRRPHYQSFVDEVMQSPDSPPRSVMSNNAGSVSSLDTLRTASSAGVVKFLQEKQKQRVPKLAIRVDRVLTGGYAMDSSDLIKDPYVGAQTLNPIPTVGPSPLPLSPMSHTDSTAESSTSASSKENELGYIFSTKKNNVLVQPLDKLPALEPGKYLYQVVASTPLSIFTGPCVDAPLTQAVLLPGTTHEVCLRYTTDDITFLRLSHRRGWIPDRKVSSTGEIARVPAVKEVLSTDSSAMSINTPLLRRRHRPPRKRTLHAKEHPVFPTPRTVPSPAMSPNVSVLSDDETPTAARTPDRSLQSESRTEDDPSCFLIRVNAPRGFMILDAPQFQVSHLIRGNQPQNKPPRGGSIEPAGTIVSKLLNSKTTPSNPAVFDAVKKQRLLPKGVLFEACQRLEQSASFGEGAGLIKLADKSGWAIVPGREELEHQYRHYHIGLTHVKEGEATRAYEEVGNAIISGDPTVDGTDCVWVRVVAKQGIPVECPPPFIPLLDDFVQPPPNPSPPSSTGGSSTSGGGSNFGVLSAGNSDVASSVGSAFLDAMFRTPKRGTRDTESSSRETLKRSHPPPFYATDPSNKSSDKAVLPCGMYFQINKWEDTVSPSLFSFQSQEYVRIRGSQGWVPRTLVGKPAVERIPAPRIRFGSFWFRVLAHRGIKVRLGPSHRATSIKSDDEVYFRFECGEFLRASEVVTFDSHDSSSAECFAKLYRNRHVRLHKLQRDGIRLLQLMTTPAEWVQVFAEDFVFLEECAAEPQIERHRSGWRYSVLLDVPIRRGPSLTSETTGLELLVGDSVLVTERVRPAGEAAWWLKLKDGRGWVQSSMEEGGEPTLVPQSRMDRKSLLQRAPTKAERPAPDEQEEIAYNTLIARLFPQDEEDERRGRRINQTF